ncbi:O-antigen ligase family protein [Parahaliea mediterranea]|uniref:Uncharacterized protein n=1 Tax=Parahaliea mediterranea TaxID=651086 RepID=A0A939DH59_9GAMM|nr:hypothetical protein [Parahaliea mediterranea]MBN7797422.1 hypothetical protein [Parahaliea mediterranea]
MSTPNRERWKNNGVFSPKPENVVRFLAGWILLSLTVPPFFRYPVLEFWLLPLGVGYLLLLLFLPRLWIYLLPLCTVVLGLEPLTGRVLFNELDFLFLLTVSAGLMYHRFRLQVYRPTPVIALLAGLLAIVSLSFPAWHAFVAPPGPLYSNPVLTEYYGYAVAKGMFWALLLVPMWGHALATNKGASVDALVRGLSLAGMAVLLSLLSGVGPMAEAARPIDPMQPLIPLLVSATLHGAYHGRGATRWLGGLGTASLIGAMLVLGDALVMVGATVAAALYLLLEGRAQLRRQWRLPLAPRTAFLSLAAACLAISLGVLLLDQGRELSMAERYERWQAAFSNSGPLMAGSGAGRAALHYVNAAPSSHLSPSDFLVHNNSPRSVIQLPANPALRIGQRLRIQPQTPYNLILSARSASGGTLALRLCNRGLAGQVDRQAQCAFANLTVPADPGEFTALDLELNSSNVGGTPNLSLWPAELTVANISDSGAVEIDFIALTLNDINRLRNSSFSDGFDHWFYLDAPENYPGQTRNMYLQWILEYGWLGLALMLAMIAMLVRNSVQPHARRSLAPVYLSAVCALCLYGLVESPLISARVSWLFHFFLFSGIAGLRLGSRERQAQQRSLAV